MIKRIKNSLAYRLPVLYKIWLSGKTIKPQPGKANSGDVVLMMTGKSIISMTCLAVLSIAKAWHTLPDLIVVTDGTISVNEIKEKLHFWPGNLTVNNWQLTEAYHTQKNRPNLIRYAGMHVLGKKMAVIFHYSELQAITWIDSDILFYNDFTKYIPHNQGFACGGSEEGASLYDDRVLNFYNDNLYNVFKFSSGLLYLNGLNVYEAFNLETLLQETNAWSHYFTEQTILGHIANKSLGIIWPATLVKNHQADNAQIKPMPVTGVIARHYTANVRHLFWRDAFFNF